MSWLSLNTQLSPKTQNPIKASISSSLHYGNKSMECNKQPQKPACNQIQLCRSLWKLNCANLAIIAMLNSEIFITRTLSGLSFDFNIINLNRLARSWNVFFLMLVRGLFVWSQSDLSSTFSVSRCMLKVKREKKLPHDISWWLLFYLMAKIKPQVEWSKYFHRNWKRALWSSSRLLKS